MKLWPESTRYQSGFLKLSIIFVFIFILSIIAKGLSKLDTVSINEVTHLGGRGSAKRGHYLKWMTRGKGGVKNLKKWVTSFMERIRRILTKLTKKFDAVRFAENLRSIKRLVECVNIFFYLRRATKNAKVPNVIFFWGMITFV